MESGALKSMQHARHNDHRMLLICETESADLIEGTKATKWAAVRGTREGMHNRYKNTDVERYFCYIAHIHVCT